MANRKLNSIKFPDIADTYILDAGKVEYHETDTFDADTAGKALQNKANIDGSYESMTVGNAEQLVSNVRVNDKTPYLFRTSGGSVDIGDREYINAITGGSLAWNQLARPLNDTYWIIRTDTGSGTIENEEATITASNVFASLRTKSTQRISYVSGHKYLIVAKAKASTSITMRFGHSKASGYFSAKTTTLTSAYSEYSDVFQEPETISAETSYFECTNSANGDVIYIKNINLFDLTQMFGSTIADYIYSLETANAGAGVAWFKKLFPKPYYAYDAGTLKSVSGLVSHDMTGFNQWDEEWESGKYDSVGAKAVDASKIRSKNYIPCLPNTAYYINISGAMHLCFYDADKNFISYVDTSPMVRTTPNDCHYMAFSMFNAYGTTYKNDICINLHWDGSRDGEYEEYELHSYPLDSDLTLRGIPKLDANNSLYYDGDTYESDGTVTRKYAYVDMGSLTWDKYTISSDYGTLFYTDDITSAVAKMVAIHSVCSKYVTYPNSYNQLIGTDYSMPDKAMRIHNETGRVYVRDESISGTGADFKNSVNGVYLVYELATPTTETADSYQSPQIVDDFGTEEYVDTRDVAIPVGHDTDYPVNLVAKLEMAPNSPDGSGDYIVRQTNGVNEYVPLVIEDALPQIPSTAGTYTLTVTVTDGADPVLSWEA